MGVPPIHGARPTGWFRSPIPVSPANDLASACVHLNGSIGRPGRFGFSARLQHGTQIAVLAGAPLVLARRGTRRQFAVARRLRRRRVASRRTRPGVRARPSAKDPPRSRSGTRSDMSPPPSAERCSRVGGLIRCGQGWTCEPKPRSRRIDSRMMNALLAVKTSAAARMPVYLLMTGAAAWSATASR